MKPEPFYLVGGPMPPGAVSEEITPENWEEPIGPFYLVGGPMPPGAVSEEITPDSKVPEPLDYAIGPIPLGKTSKRLASSLLKKLSWSYRRIFAKFQQLFLV